MFLSEFFNKNHGVTENQTEGEATLAKIAASGDDGYEMIYDGLNGLLGGEAEIILQDMYDDVSREHRLHPDDDFEQIQSLMMDRIESEYGQGVTEEQLDEISDRAMHKYRQGAHNQIQHHMFGGGKNKPNAQAIIAKREKGMDVASNKIIARRKSEQDKRIAELIAKLPELKARYAELEAQYKSLGGSNWQYADREQNLTDTERRARDLEGPMNDLWRQINAAEKAQREQGVAEGICSECGGPAFSNLLLAEKQDACYNKVKSRYKVWPSAYASGALVQCRKKGAANWGNKSESVAEGTDPNTQSHADAFKSETDTMKPGTSKYVGRKGGKEVTAKKDEQGNVKFYHRDGIKGPLKRVNEMDSQGYTGSRDKKSSSKYGSRDDYELGKGKEHTGKSITADKMIKAAKKAWDYATEPVDAPDMATYKKNRAKNIEKIRKQKEKDQGVAEGSEQISSMIQQYEDMVELVYDLLPGRKKNIAIDKRDALEAQIEAMPGGKEALRNWAKSYNDAMDEGVAEGKEDKIAQLKKDYATAVHWSKNETSPQKREAARQKAEKIKGHLEKQYKQGMAEGANRLDMVGFHLDSERAYNAVMSRFGHVIDYDEDSGIMYVPERLWPTVEVVAYDADGIGAQRDDDLENPEHYGVAEDQLDENLKKWFKEKWVRFGPDGKIRGACARGDSSEGKPKCLPQSKAHALGKKGRASAAAKKRREDPNPERKGPAINVATKKKSNEGIAEDANHSMLELSSMIFSNIEKKYPQLINTLGQSSVSDAVMSAVENAGSVNSVDEVYSILQDVISILKKKSKTLPMSETKLYYNVVGTVTESLKNNFKMSQDTHGWYIANTASETLHRAAERAFGAPKKS